MIQPIWQAQYQPGVPNELEPPPFSSLVDLFTRTCQRFADKVAFENFGATLTYHQLEQQSRQFAAYLQHILELKKGDCVAIMLPNVLQFPIALFGILRAGLVFTNINPLYTSDELTHQLRDSNAKVIIVLENFAHTVAQALPETDLKHVIVTHLGDSLPFPKAQVINFMLKYVKKAIPNWHIPNAIWFNQLLNDGNDLGLCPVTLNDDDIACLQYTGGTTGQAKGAVLLHRNLLANVDQVIAWTADTLEVGKEIVITALPLYHVFALTVNLFAFFRLGARNVLISNPRDIPRFITQLIRTRFTFITGVNTLFNALLHHPKFDQIDFSSVKFSIAGGMAVQQSVAQAWQKRTGTVLLQGYGLTEASPVVSMNPLDVKKYNSSIGLPLPSTHIGIFDEQGQALSIEETGELWVKGPQVMAGYWQSPQLTNQVITQEGWLKTGDLAKVDAQGFIYLIDRKKDMINVSGFKVFPNEVEEVIADYPDVDEVGVIGMPCVQTGEQVIAFVTVNDKPSFDSQQLLAHCHDHLTGYKIPKQIIVVDQLPKTNVGKVLRRQLRELAQAQLQV
ncbi:MAG: AMP-binding protein [Legionellales bacterium]|nr:AMP-binding protein [Legionellales bacterium]